MHEKTSLRQDIRDRLRGLSAKERDIESRVIVKELRKIIGEARTIAGFVPFIDEPDIRPLLEEYLAQGRSIMLPAVDANRLVFRRIFALKDAKKNPLTNIHEPPVGDEPVDPTALDIVIVPGRAFTASGERLGRGNGGYDHWIHKQRAVNPNTRYVGVCFECQLLPKLPTETHDEKVDAVVTTRGTKSAS